MAWFAKFLGGAVGLALGGPIGGIIGLALGHQVDRARRSAVAESGGRGRRRTRGNGDGGAAMDWSGARGGGQTPSKQERRQAAFFTAVFSVMGHIAKADGKVCESEIDFAARLMSEMRLDAERRKAAREMFRAGKAPDFPIDGVLAQLKRECRGAPHLTGMFMRILLHTAYANGNIKPEEMCVLEHVCVRLGISAEEFEAMDAAARNEPLFARARDSRGVDLHDAYLMLGVDEKANNDELKRAYRRLMNRHHPDKLVAKGMPEEMVRIATERTQEIRRAYELVRSARAA